MQDMDSDELTHWLAMESIDPFVMPTRMDYLTAHVVQVIAGAFGNRLSLDDCRLRFRDDKAEAEQRRRDKEATMVLRLQAFASVYNRARGYA